MKYKVNISDLSVSQLNAACLTKISKFIVALEKLDGRILELKNENLMRKLVKIGKQTKDPGLQELYQAIKRDISKHINSQKFNQEYENSNSSVINSKASKELSNRPANDC